jgi:hypothetical protein
MKPITKSLLAGLSPQNTSPAFRQILKMAENRSTEIDSSAPLQSAKDVLSVWSIRLWNATLRGRRFVGLADFVRSLMTLQSDAKIEQIALRNGPKVGLIFFDAKSRIPVGAVVSMRLAMANSASR